MESGHVFLIALVSILCLALSAAAQGQLVGWATENGGTTGGEGGTTVTVTNVTDLRNALNSSSPTIVQVDGIVDVGSTGISYKSNKTLVGLGASSGWTGRIQFSGCHNFIVRNLNVSSPVMENSDGISVLGGSENFWVDHCSFGDCTDGQLDITQGASYVTVSWCKFNYPTQVDHCFSSLVGAGDTVYTDRGRLLVTYHHNFWTTGCDERMPRVRFGRVHVFNNYYYIPGHLGSCIKSTVEAQLLVENNYFENCRGPYQAENGGFLKAIGNVLDGTYGPLTGGSDDVFSPPYDYTLEPPASARSNILAGAGAGGSTLPPGADSTPPSPDPMGWAVEPQASGAYSIEMTASAATDLCGVQYYFANLTDPTHDSGWQDGAGYTDTALSPTTSYTYAVKARDKSVSHNETAESPSRSATTTAAPPPPGAAADPRVWLLY
ncbi:hypothetical protein JW916_15800 [Candidatus Sumerlaeota bacterium]|nr:hypothetical protein [Candidatus Sumerlaeota bacterium]